MYDDTAAALFDYHHSMLVDRIRIDTFLKALMAVVRPGDVVVDIGAGTGVLSMFAIMAGARQVYAIEEGPIGEVATQAIERNGFSDRIELVRGRSTEVELPQKGTVLVTETIGNAGLEEGITAWVRDAHARLLSPDARVVPLSVAVMAAPVEVFSDHGELSRWNRPLHTLDFSPLAQLGTGSLLWAEFARKDLVAEPEPVIAVELVSPPPNAASGLASFRAERDAVVHGLGVWFVAELAQGLELSNAPPLRTPSWNQAFLAFRQPIDLRAGDEIQARIQTASDGGAWEWSADTS